MNVTIRQIELDEIDLIIQVVNHLPEFSSIFYKQDLRRKLEKRESILLVAEQHNQPIACIVCYNRYYDASVFIWQVSVLPEFRNHGIANTLFLEMEIIARRRLFLSIRMQARNKDQSLLYFALRNQFEINGFHANEHRSESKIVLIKML
ncbi:MAG: GNAT family N-acetyltransferase [Prolixibacteraceae bacterium]